MVLKWFLVFMDVVGGSETCCDLLFMLMLDLRRYYPTTIRYPKLIGLYSEMT